MYLWLHASTNIFYTDNKLYVMMTAYECSKNALKQERQTRTRQTDKDQDRETLAHSRSQINVKSACWFLRSCSWCLSHCHSLISTSAPSLPNWSRADYFVLERTESFFGCHMCWQISHCISLQAATQWIPKIRILNYVTKMSHLVKMSTPTDNIINDIDIVE